MANCFVKNITIWLLGFALHVALAIMLWLPARLLAMMSGSKIQHQPSPTDLNLTREFNARKSGSKKTQSTPIVRREYEDDLNDVHDEEISSPFLASTESDKLPLDLELVAELGLESPLKLNNQSAEPEKNDHERNLLFTSDVDIEELRCPSSASSVENTKSTSNISLERSRCSSAMSTTSSNGSHRRRSIPLTRSYSPDLETPKFVKRHSLPFDPAMANIEMRTMTKYPPKKSYLYISSDED